jgi:hypothetical protein
MANDEIIFKTKVDAEWWRSAVIYQIYPRSFADGNGDGIGDLRGVQSRLDSLVELGIDAIWFSPFMLSPQKDAGYDITDYCQIDPLFGTMDDFDSVGVGMGQVNRVDSCRLAIDRADHRAKDSVAASDAFFPFKDGVELLIEAGVRAIVQPGGSMRDQEVIDAAKAAGVTMYFTGERHFFH